MSDPAPQQHQYTPSAVTPVGERLWYLRPQNAMWLGPLLIVVCVALRFGWGGLEGPPFPFWGLAYIAGAAGIVLTYHAIGARKSR
jgi:hypothetical protein